MQTHVKAHWTKLSILSLLLFVWGALLPAYACSPEVDNAVARLQKSARAEISVDEWLAQIVSKTSYLHDVISTGNAIGREMEEMLQATSSLNKQSLIYLKQYLADVKIRQDTHGEWEAPRKFQFNKEESYTYYYIYPFSVSYDDGSESTCQLGVLSAIAEEVEEWEFAAETTFLYFFDIKDGEMKLIKVDMAG